MLAAAPQALSVTGVPLRNTSGVVVAWSPAARANVVTTMDNRVLVIHSLRRYRPGTRVRIRGIKWGRSMRGVKWGFRPRGIKWGIMQARNGTYFAGLRPMGRTTKLRLRGTVVRRYTHGVGISVAGATFTLRTAPGAWTSGSNLMSMTPSGGIGSQVQFDVRVNTAGRATVIKARELRPATPSASVPYAGTVIAVNPSTGVVIVDATTDPAFPLRFVLTTPIGTNLASVRRGQRISGTATTSPIGGSELFATAIADNSSFTAADNAAAVVTMHAPDAAMLVSIHTLRAKWRQEGVAEGRFTLEGLGLAAAGGSQLALVERALMRNDLPTALDRLTRVIVLVQNANLPAGSPIKIEPNFQASLLADAGVLHRHLTGLVLTSSGTSTETTTTDPAGESGGDTVTSGAKPDVPQPAGGTNNGTDNGLVKGGDGGTARAVGPDETLSGAANATTNPGTGASVSNTDNANAFCNDAAETGGVAGWEASIDAKRSRSMAVTAGGVHSDGEAGCDR